MNFSHNNTIIIPSSKSFYAFPPDNLDPADR